MADKNKGTGEAGLGLAAVSSEATKVLHEEIHFLSEFYREWKPEIEAFGNMGVTARQLEMVADFCNKAWQPLEDSKVVGKGKLIANSPNGTTHKLTVDEIAKAWGIPRSRQTLQGLIRVYGPIRLVAFQEAGAEWPTRTKTEFKALYPKALEVSKSGVSANSVKTAAMTDERYKPIFEGMASKRKQGTDRAASLVQNLCKRFAKIGRTVIDLATMHSKGELDKSDVPFAGMSLGQVHTLHESLSQALERATASNADRTLTAEVSKLDALLIAVERTERKRKGSKAEARATPASEPVLV